MNALPSSPGAARSGASHSTLRGLVAVMKAITPWNLLAAAILTAAMAVAVALPIAPSSIAGIVAFLPLALILPGWMALWQALRHEHVPAVRHTLWIALIALIVCSHAFAAALALLSGGDAWMALSVNALCVAVLLGLTGIEYMLLWAACAAVAYGIVPLGDEATIGVVAISLTIGFWLLPDTVMALLRREEWRFRMVVSVLWLLHVHLMFAPEWVDRLATDSYLTGLSSGTGMFLLALWTLGPLWLWQSLTKATPTEPTIEYLGVVEWLHGFRAGHRRGLRDGVAASARPRTADQSVSAAIDVTSDATLPAVKPERWRVALLRKCLGPPIAADLDSKSLTSVGWSALLMLCIFAMVKGGNPFWILLLFGFLSAWATRLYRLQRALRALILGEPASPLAELQLLPSWRSAGGLRRLLPAVATTAIARETWNTLVFFQLIAWMIWIDREWVLYAEFAVAVLSYGAMQACLALVLLSTDPSRMRAPHSFGLIATAYGLSAGGVSHLMLSLAGAPWWWLAALWPLLPMFGVVVFLIRTRRAATQ